jgi:hypothetical protein
MALSTSSLFSALLPRPAPRPPSGVDPALVAYRWGKPTVGEWTFSSGGRHWAPITVYLHGTLGQVVDALAWAGWREVPFTFECAAAPGSAACGAAFERTLLGRWPPPPPARYAPRGRSTVLPEPAATPELLYQGELPVLVYEKDADPLGRRRHLRVYDTAQSDSDGAEVWAVCLGRDLGLAFSPRRPTRYLTPEAGKDADGERDALLQDLAAARALANARAFLVSWQDLGPEHPCSRDGQVYDLVLR